MARGSSETSKWSSEDIGGGSEAEQQAAGKRSMPGKTATEADQGGGNAYQKKLGEGWQGLTIKAGEASASRKVLYDPATHKLELGEDRWGAGGEEFKEGQGEDLPEVQVVEDRDGAVVQMDRALDHDVTMVCKVVGEIRK